jgi:hypothetical protein
MIMALSMIPVWAHGAIWQDLSEPELAAKGASAQTPVYYRALKANRAELSLKLAAAPLEGTSSQGASLELPMPDGSMQQFEVVNSPILSAELTASYPDIATYAVRGIDNPHITGRLDLTPDGFHAMLSTPGGTVFINPDDEGGYRSFHKQDFIAEGDISSSDRACHFNGKASAIEAMDTAAVKYAARTLSSAFRRVYRLAVTTTSGYSQVYSNSESAIFSSVVTAVNRVNQVYARDLGVLLQLTAVLAQIDVSPFSGLTQSQMLAKNQALLDAEFGVSAYDLGHIFAISGGGLAQLGAACTSLKAHGLSGYPNPNNDVFYIDLLAHELGHQLDATHSFNGSAGACAGANREASTAVEPGSGSTIMAYAGICDSENIQLNSDAVFHAVSIDQINSFVFSGSGSSCGSLQATGNSMPDVNAGSNVIIPQETPFFLTIDPLTDPDGDTLSYQWDQMDANGIATTGVTLGQDLGDNPLFRSFVPKNTPKRYFPRLSTLLAGGVAASETLPTTSRNLNFRLTVRDGNSGVGDDDLTVGVDPAMGPFKINNVTQGSGTLFIDWDPSDTDIFCPELNVSLLSFSSDGSTYCDEDDNPDLNLNPTPLVTNGAGSTLINLPTDLSVDRARVMLACANGVFFALSGTDLTISSPNPAVASDCKSIDGEEVPHGSVSVPPATDDVTQGGVKYSSGGGALSWMLVLLLIPALLKLPRVRSIAK